MYIGIKKNVFIRNTFKNLTNVFGNCVSVPVQLQNNEFFDSSE